MLHRPTRGAGRLPALPAAALAIVASLLAWAPAAWADDLQVLVGHTVAPGEDLPVVLRTDRAGDAEVVVVRLGADHAAIDGGRIALTAEQLGWIASDPRAERQAAGSPAYTFLHGVQAEVVDRRRVTVRQGGERTSVAIRVPDAGVHVIDVRFGQARVQVPALVSALGLVVKRHAGGALVWCVDRRDGRPWPGVGVQAVGGGTAPRSDAYGLVRLDAMPPGDLALQAQVLATHEGRPQVHRALGTRAWYPSMGADHRVHVMTHQPAYRPGEQVHVRGIVRAAGPEGLSLDAGVGEVQVALQDPAGARLGTARTARVGASGTFAADLDLPAGARTGAWQVVATVAGREHAAPLRVEAFRRPPFEVRVAALTPRVRVGTTARLRIEAAYLAGGALAGAPVTWLATHTRVAPDPFPDSDLVRLFFGTEREAFRPVTVAEGQGVLGADGSLEIEVPVAAGLEDGWLALAADVVGPGRLHVGGRGTASVTARPWRLGLRTDRHLYGAEDQPRVEVRLEAADGSSTAGLAGVVTVAQVLEDGTEAWSTPQRFVLDAEGRADLAVALGAAGRYRLRASVEAPDGSTPTAVVHAYALPTEPTRGLPAPSLEVRADRDAYRVGDVAHLLVRAPGQTSAALVTVEGARLFDVRVVELVDGTAVVDVPLVALHTPNVYVTVTAVEAGTAATRVRLLRVPSAAPLLTTRVVPDAAVAAPGSTIGFTVEVADHRGAPVPDADLAFAVVDDALYTLFASPQVALERFFHPPQRNEVGTETLFDVVGVGRDVFAPPAGNLEAERARPGRGTGGSHGGRFRAPGGDRGPPPPASPAPQPASSDDAPVDSPMTGVAGGGDGGDAFGALEEASEEDGEVALDADDGHEARRGGSGPAKKLKDGGDADLRAEARRLFLASIHWSPSLRTGADGRVRVEGVRLADDLTRWRATAWAVDGATRVGSGVGFVQAFTPVEVRMTLPRFLRVGDEVEMPVVVRNRTADPLTAVEVRVHRLGATDPLLETRHERLGAGEVAVATTPLEARDDAADLLLDASVRALGAAGERLGDAEQLPLAVLPQGVPRHVGTATAARDGRAVAEVRVPAAGVAGTWRAHVRVQAGFRTAVEDALPYLIDYPHGCTEQTVNRFVPLVVAAGAPWGAGPQAATYRPLDRSQDVAGALEAGLARLEALRHDDGGFGWWPTDASGLEMTALVLDALNRAATLATHDVAGGPGGPGGDPVAALGLRSLGTIERLRAGARAWLAAAVAAAQGPEPYAPGAPDALAVLALAEAGPIDPAWLEAALQAWVRRGSAADPLTTALLLRAAMAARLDGPATRLAAHLEDAAVREADGSVNWQPEARPGGVDRWEVDPVHATAEAGLALLEAGGDTTLVRGAARWLLGHRDGGTTWGSTRDTAAAVRLLTALAVRLGDTGLVGDVEIRRGDEVVGVVTEAAAHLPRERQVEVDGGLPGSALRFEAVGTRDSIFALVVTLEGIEAGPALQPADEGLGVTRRWWILAPTTSPGGVVWTRAPLEETVPTGTLVECELVVTSTQDRRYVMITNPHVAGFEPEEVVGVRVPGEDVATLGERDVRDDRTHDWIPFLPADRPVLLRQRFRATHVGRFTALPAQAGLMYYPAIGGRSHGEVLEVRRRDEEGR